MKLDQFDLIFFGGSVAVFAVIGVGLLILWMFPHAC